MHEPSSFSQSWANDALAPRVRALFVAEEAEGDLFVTGCDHSYGPFPDPVIAAREGQIMWAARFSNKATFCQIAIDANAGCSFVVAFGAGGRASSSKAL